MSLKISLNGRCHALSVQKLRPHLVLAIDGVQRQIVSPPSAGVATGVATIDGRPVGFVRAQDRDVVWVRIDGRTYTVKLDDPFAASTAAAGGDVLRAPMPGGVIDVHCAVGDSMLRGDPVLTIESMKLQTTLRAPRDGVIDEILAGAGQTFEKDAVLVRLAPIAGDA